MPLTPGNSRAAISSNISELTHHGSRPRSHDQIVAIALSNADRHPRADGGASDISAALRIAHRDVGGFTPPAPPYFERQEESAVARSKSPYGFAVGTGSGRNDKNAVTLGSGSYVLPSDIVAGLGDGNSLAGAHVWDQILNSMPFGIQPPKSAGHRGPPAPPHDAALMAGITGAGPQGEKAFAEGGETEGVPIIAADGEILVSPENVARIGSFYAPDRERGNHAAIMRRGHRILDHFVKHIRGKTIRHLESLPGPVGSKDASKGHI